MSDKKIKAVQNVPAPTDTEQPPNKCNIDIITFEDEDFKSYEDIEKKMLLIVKTYVTLREIFCYNLIWTFKV
ncbi:MAG: hypothetical protein IJZ94_00240 [Clostridia bacterium]|nr:hypothetical protein [Clostridia bacterium]